MLTSCLIRAHKFFLIFKNLIMGNSLSFKIWNVFISVPEYKESYINPFDSHFPSHSKCKQRLKINPSSSTTLMLRFFIASYCSIFFVFYFNFYGIIRHIFYCNPSHCLWKNLGINNIPRSELKNHSSFCPSEKLRNNVSFCGCCGTVELLEERVKKLLFKVFWDTGCSL